MRHLARLPALRHLDLSGTAITDRGLEVLRDLPALETLSLGRNAHHRRRHRRTSRTVTSCGSVNLRGRAPVTARSAPSPASAKLHDFASGNDVTDAGIALLHELPVFKSWHGGEPKMALLSYRSAPNQLSLRGPFTDRGMEQMRGLDGLFGLNLDDRDLAITAAALEPLVSLPHLGWLGVDAKDDWMPYIAAMPRLRFLGAQDTAAGDDGFVALSKSQSIEYIWGRRCHNLRERGFLALANMPALRGLSVSCLNVDDAGCRRLPDVSRVERADADGRSGRRLPAHRQMRAARVARSHVLPRHDRRGDASTSQGLRSSRTTSTATRRSRIGRRSCCRRWTRSSASRSTRVTT